MLIQPQNKLLFIGDSITDCDRAHPVGEGIGLGNGYVSLINAWLTATYPQAHLRLLNVGTSGNTVRDLKNRWETDVLKLKPDWLTVMIGINDVWRQFDTPLQTEAHVALAEYTTTLDALLQKTRPTLKGLVLMTPYFIEPSRNDPMRAMMDKYGKAVRELARKHKAIFVDTQAAFDAILQSTHPMSLAWDRVHPNLTGHAILARAFLKAVEYKG
ncbi:MAG: SGNH/GDSL hydrolase family protein [Anaerolineales bacterium]|nr:SGNH/GDSL hydrolase family protein [Anaerolineales bacterium]